jgi:hypothetical protein
MSRSRAKKTAVAEPGAEGTHCDACKVTTTEELVEVKNDAGVISRICPGCKEGHDKAQEAAAAAAAPPAEEPAAPEGDDDDQVDDDEGDDEVEGDGEEDSDDSAGDAGGEGEVLS